MKYAEHREGAAGRLQGRIWSLRSLGTAGRSACMVALLCAPVLAQGGDGPGDAVSSGGDETVGTLPIIGGRMVKLPTISGWRGDRPAFYMQGTADDIATSLLAARGTGYITVEVLDPALDTVRVAFHGNVSVVLDRDLMETLPIQTGLAVPASFAPRSVVLGSGTQPSRALALHPGFLPIAVGELSRSRTLDAGPLEVRASGRWAHATTSRIYATRDALILRQTD